ncbi:MAG: T9SS type A sorting domain-containing protein [Bacteroidales bacterium]|nr:T9SS type A sorting domain-containing protein [Bacteroidales bacterium]
MKRLFIILLVLCVVTNLHAQQKSMGYQDADTTYLLKPEAFNYDCNPYNFMMGDPRDSSVFDYPYFVQIYPAMTKTSSRTVLGDVAQPYFQGTNVAINGVVVYGMIDTTTRLDNDNEYIRILDENFNTLVETRYDNISNANGISMYLPINNLIEIKFDTTIVVSGTFYVSMSFNSHFDTTDNMTIQTSRQFQWVHCLSGVTDWGWTPSSYISSEHTFACDSSDGVKYDLPRFRLQFDSVWHKFSEYNQVLDNLGINNIINSHIAVLSLYPQIDTAFDWATWNAQNSALNDIQEREKQINVFPNPAKDKITIESATELESIEIKNILGITQKSLNVKRNKVTVPISDLEKGTYLVSIRTSDGNHTKKIVKE